MDALPGYTYFDPGKKVLCVIQIIEDATAASAKGSTVMGHTDDEKLKAYSDDEVKAGMSKDNWYIDSVTGQEDAE